MFAVAWMVKVATKEKKATKWRCVGVVLRSKSEERAQKVYQWALVFVEAVICIRA